MSEETTNMGIEESLFSWDGWDSIDTFVAQFYDCVLKVKIGDYNVGEKIGIIAIDFGQSFIDLYSDINDKPNRYKISLVVGDKIPQE